MNELQRVVDNLANTTNRAVAVHDRAGRLLAYSAHQPDVDEVRKQSILTRKGPARPLAWSRTFGIDEATEPVRIPAYPEGGMGPRVCATVRFDGKLIGYVWLVDQGEPLADEQLDTVQAAADSAAIAIRHQQLTEELERGRERELLRDLLSDQAAVRTHAVEELTEDGIFHMTDRVVVLVARPVRDRRGAGAEDRAVRAALERGLAQVRRNLPPRQVLPLIRPGHGLLLMTVRAFQSPPGGPVEQAAAQLQDAVAANLPERWKSVVGIGEPRTTLDEAHLTYRHARQAAEVCGIVESFAAVTGWWQLGVYQTLLELPLDTVSNESLHPGLVKLLEARDGSVWLETLERYLDLGCDARAAARALNVQRGSLYHRLHRIEQLAQVDLNRGDDRLALHLGLKLARLAGLLDASARAEVRQVS